MMGVHGASCESGQVIAELMTKGPESPRVTPGAPFLVLGGLESSCLLDSVLATVVVVIAAFVLIAAPMRDADNAATVILRAAAAYAAIHSITEERGDGKRQALVSIDHRAIRLGAIGGLFCNTVVRLGGSFSHQGKLGALIGTAGGNSIGRRLGGIGGLGESAGRLNENNGQDGEG